MVQLVERMLKLPKAKGASRTAIERQVAATDKSIDAPGRELHGLTAMDVVPVEVRG